jgi:hypothetical protein
VAHFQKEKREHSAERLAIQLICMLSLPAKDVTSARWMGSLVMRFWIPSVVAALFIGACAAHNPLDIAQTDDPFRSYREYTSSNPQGVVSSGGLLSLDTFLSARVDKNSGALSIKLIAHLSNGSDFRRKYKTAANIHAQPLDVSIIAHHGSCDRNYGCVRSELLEISLPEADLRNLDGDEYKLKLFAVVGPDITISIPKAPIVALMAKADADPAVAKAGGGKVVAQTAH